MSIVVKTSKAALSGVVFFYIRTYKIPTEINTYVLTSVDEKESVSISAISAQRGRRG